MLTSGRIAIITGLLALAGAGVAAHGYDYEAERKSLAEQYGQYRKGIQEEYEAYRAKLNEQYAAEIGKEWKGFKKKEAVRLPADPEPKPAPVIDDDGKKFRNFKRVVIDTVVVVPPAPPRPEPVVPIVAPAPKPVEPAPTPKPVEPKPAPKPVDPKPVAPKPVEPMPEVSISFYGTPVRLAGAKGFSGFRLNGVAAPQIADGWRTLSSSDNNAFIASCLSTRDNLSLPDWGYFQLVDEALSKYSPKRSAAHTLMMGYVLAQSGYTVRFAADTDDALHLLFNSDGIIYGRSRFVVDGKDYYTYEVDTPDYMFISQTGFEGEKKFSILIDRIPKFAYKPGNTRDLQVKRIAGIELKATPNRNLLDFYAGYPNGTFDKSNYTRWAVQGNTPMSREVSDAIYPVLRSKVAGKTQSEAVNILLKVAQSFDYGLDDEIWGEDRTFWPEESWHYPLSDCEDHAVHFTRLVRDLLGLDAVLIYYPGHLSSAVAITDGSASGDWVGYGGKHYTVCDATYFYAPAGRTAPGNDNAKAVLIPLRR